jgi:hypothetical protein
MLPHEELEKLVYDSGIFRQRRRRLIFLPDAVGLEALHQA